MAKASTRKVTRAEIEATLKHIKGGVTKGPEAYREADGRQSSAVPYVYAAQNSPATSGIYTSRRASGEPYFKKLKDQEIFDWFAPFGYIAHSLTTDTDSNTEFLLVQCEDFAVLLNDNTLYLEEMPKQRGDNYVGSFDYIKFKEQCFHQNITPEQALNAYIKDKLEKRFTSYATARLDSDRANLKKIRDDRRNAHFSKEIDRLFELLEGRDSAILDIEANRVHFGSYRPNGD